MIRMNVVKWIAAGTLSLATLPTLGLARHTPLTASPSLTGAVATTKLAAKHAKAKHKKSAHARHATGKHATKSHKHKKHHKAS